MAIVALSLLLTPSMNDLFITAHFFVGYIQQIITKHSRSVGIQISITGKLKKTNI